MERQLFTRTTWGVGPGESASFPSKWLAADGQPAWLVFSGDDSFSIRRATLQLVSDWQTTPDSAEARGQQLTIARFLPHYRIPGINGIRLKLNATMRRIHRSNILPNRVIDFFIVGAHKAGTTSLYDHLAQHPQIFLPQIKETRFFHEPVNLSSRSKLAGATLSLRAGDSSSGWCRRAFLILPRSSARLHEYNPHV